MRTALTAPSLLLAASLLSAAVVSQAAPPGHGAEDPKVPAGETPAPPSVWVAEWGGFNHIEDIAAVSASSVWAAGSNAVHFDGASWRAVDRRDYPAELEGIDVTRLGNGWVVGDQEEAIPIRGGVLGESMHVPGYRFRDVAMVSEDEALAVAHASTSGASEVLRYRDGAWHQEWSSPGVGLTSMWMASATEGWIAGRSAFRYRDRAWTEWPLPVEGGIREIAGTGPDDVWAVGGPLHLPRYPEIAPPRRVILHFDGRGWRIVSDEAKSAIWAIALQGSEGVAVAIDGLVLRRQGDSWIETNTRIPADDFPFRGIVTAATYVPGTSKVLVANYDGWVYSLEGDDVTVERDADSFHSVAMLNATKGWALGRDVLEYDGDGWRVIEGALDGATDVATVGGEEAWAVGPGPRVLEYREEAWAAEALPFDADLLRVVVPAPRAVWVLGGLPTSEGEAAQSAVYTRFPDGTWATAWRGPGEPRDLAVSGATAAVATADGIWVLDGANWSQVRDEGAWSVGIGPAGELWAGIDGTILAFDGDTWQDQGWLPGSWPVRAFANGANASWAVADWGYIYAFEGGVWRIVRGEAESRGVAGATYGLRDIATVQLEDGTSYLWAVGAPDTILRAVESEALAQPAVTPEPSPEGHRFPTASWASWPSTAYLPALDVVAGNRSEACAGAPGAPAAVIREAALGTARFYAAGGPQPEPRLGALHMLTASEADEEHGTSLVGSEVRGRVVGAGECIWWASFEGWFDCQCDTGTPAPTPPARNHVWTRLDLALFSDDATVLYEEFSGRRSRPPEPTLVPTREGPRPTPTALLLDAAAADAGPPRSTPLPR